MKRLVVYLVLVFLVAPLAAQVGNLTPITLQAPDKTRGLPVMQAFARRSSLTSFTAAPISVRDLSDLLWAANGVNRPDGKRTAPSAVNAQDIDIYAFMEQGVYLYDARQHQLVPVVAGDHRALNGFRAGEPVPALCLLLVSDVSRFRMGTDSLKLVFAAEDAGIVSQNISLFCAGVGLGTRPRALMDTQGIKTLLQLGPTRHPMLNHPVCPVP